MVRIVIWGALALAGCGRVAFEAVGDGGGDGGDGVGDRDAPVPSCIGHDEDGDGFPDACDDCPSVANPDQRDVGEILAGNAADGVGDACDPRPTLPGDYIAMAAMHVDASEASHYNTPTGAIAWTNDAVRIGSVGGNGQLYFDLPDRMTRLEARVTVVDVALTDQFFGVWYDGDNMEAVFASGSYIPTGGDTVASFSLEQDSLSTGMSLSASYFAPAIFASGQQFDIVVDTALATGTTDTMSTIDGSGTHPVSLDIQIPLLMRGYLEADHMTLDYEHFVVYAAH